MKKKNRKSKPQPKPRPSKPEALVVYENNRAVELAPRQVELIKNLCAKEATPDEFEVFLQLAKHSRLDPFKKELYCLIFSPHDTRKRQMVIVTGIGGYRTMAARYHSDYDGCGKPVFEFATPPRLTPSRKPIPESCTMEIYAKGSTHPTISTVYWDEFAPHDLNEDRAQFWRNMPRNQLEKCCEAKGLRKRFPGLGGIYVDAELDRSRMELSPGGRKVMHDGKRPDGSTAYQQIEEYGSITAQQIADAKKRGDWCEKHKCLKIQCPADEHTAEENDAAFDQHMQDRNRTIDIPAKVTGDKKEDKKPNSTAPAQASTTPTLPAGCTLLRGTVHNVVYARTKDKRNPYINVKVNGTWVSCWSKSLCTFFMNQAAVVSGVIEAYVKGGQITGLKRLGNLHFQPDGKTPIGREPGAEG